MTNELTTTSDFDTGESDRTIVGAFAKFVDGQWSIFGLPMPKDHELLVIGTQQVLQRWQDKKVVETISTKPLPKLDDLNATIPKSGWEIGLDGKPKPPWSRSWLVYFLHSDTAEKTTYAGSSIGASIAFGILTDAVTWMRKLRGAEVFPLVRFGSKPMSTRFGVKQRPHFEIVGWKGLSPQGVTAAPAPAPQLPKPELADVKPATIDESLNDTIPW